MSLLFDFHQLLLPYKLNIHDTAMIGAKVVLDKPKKAFNKISKLFSDKSSRKVANTESSHESFQATAYVPRFWERLINISRLALFLIIIAMIFWFTMGSDLYFNYQRSSFEKNELTTLYSSNESDFQRVYNFCSQRSQKLTGLYFDKERQNFQITIEDQHMNKQPRPSMVYHVSDNHSKKDDYEKVIDGELFYNRHNRERTIAKDWAYYFTVKEGEPIQPDILSYLTTNQQETSTVMSSLKTLGHDFEIYPDSIVSTLKFQKFGKYHLMYSQKEVLDDQWEQLERNVYFKHIPLLWDEE